MDKITNFFKKLSLVLVILTCSVSGAILLSFDNISKYVNAVALVDYKPNKLSVSSSFETTSTKFPVSPSSWSTIGTKFDDTKMGIISIDKQAYDDEDYEEVTNLTFNPETKNGDADDKFILMINSKSMSKVGYKSSIIELEAKSFYHISVDVYTVYEVEDYSNSIASVKLTGNNLSSNERAYYSEIQTKNSWQTINFYIASDVLSSQEINVELRLGNNENGSRGVVFFDNFICEQISNNQYYEKKSTYSGNMIDITNTSAGDVVTYNSFVDLSNSNHVQDISTINPDFENGLESWELLSDKALSNGGNTIKGVFAIGTGTFDNVSLKTNDPTNAFRYQNTKALLINNVIANSYGYKSANISIPRNRAYVLTVDVKTDSNSNASINLKQANTLNSKDFTPITVSETSINTNLENTDPNGGWKTYYFYVKGNFAVDTEMYVELWLGETENKQGYVWFDNVKLQEITLDKYHEVAKDSTIKTLNLGSYTESSITNGLFNEVTSTEIGGTLSPKSWTVNTNAANTSNVNVSVVDFANHLNVLKVENKISTGTMVTSEEVNIAEDSKYILTFDAKIDEIVKDCVPYVVIYMTENPVYVLPLNKDYAWNSYSLQIVNGSISVNIKIAVCLGGMNDNDFKQKGIVYFDNFTLTNVNEFTETSDELLDLKTLTFDKDYDRVNDITDTKLHNSLSYATSNTDKNVVNGILDLNNFERLSANNFPSITKNPESNVGTTVYAINSDKDTYFYVQSKNVYSVGGGTYYKLSISLKTLNLGQDESSVDKENPIPYGAFIAIDEVNGAIIKGIDTKNVVANKGYKTYTIYLNAVENLEFHINFGLGQETSMTKGTLFVESVMLEKIESEAFETAEKSNDKSVLCVKYTAEEETEEEEEPQPDDVENKVDFNFLIIPTLITALALIIAIVGTLIRKYGRKSVHHVKIKNEYDRTKVLKIHNLKETIETKEAELENFKTEKENLEKALVELQPTVDMTDDEINTAKDKMYEIENEIGKIVDKIAQLEKELKSLNKEYSKM